MYTVHAHVHVHVHVHYTCTRRHVLYTMYLHRATMLSKYYTVHVHVHVQVHGKHVHIHGDVLYMYLYNHVCTHMHVIRT